jgi:hypothetical protein
MILCVLKKVAGATPDGALLLALLIVVHAVAGCRE